MRPVAGLRPRRVSKQLQIPHKRVPARAPPLSAVQWYDFLLLSYLSPTISRLFFPSDNVYTRYLALFGIFASGFLTRPLGAAAFGWVGDRCASGAFCARLDARLGGVGAQLPGVPVALQASACALLSWRGSGPFPSPAELRWPGAADCGQRAFDLHLIALRMHEGSGAPRLSPGAYTS